MKTIYWIFTIISSVVVVVMLVGVFLLSPLVNEIEEIEIERDKISLSLEDHKTQLARVKKEENDARENFDRCIKINETYEAELDTIRPKLALADSLIAANLALQAQLATAQASAKRPATAEKAATPTTEKPSKGKPVTDDVNKTFTYLASDSTAVVGLAPTGYALIKKPR